MLNRSSKHKKMIDMWSSKVEVQQLLTQGIWNGLYQRTFNLLCMYTRLAFSPSFRLSLVVPRETKRQKRRTWTENEKKRKKREEDYKRRVRSRFTWSAGAVEGERGSGVEPPWTAWEIELEGWYWWARRGSNQCSRKGAPGPGEGSALRRANRSTAKLLRAAARSLLCAFWWPPRAWEV